MNRQLHAETDPPTSPSRPHKFEASDSINSLAARVSSKLEEGDFKGAVRLDSSEDRVADKSDSTFAALKLMHLSPHPDTVIPSLLVHQSQSISVSVDEIVCAIQSFPSGSAGGPDGLRPQHLKDMTGPSANRGGHCLLTALVSFVKLVLEGSTPPFVRSFFFWCHSDCPGEEGRRD